MDNILSDQNKFTKSKFERWHLNFAVNQEKCADKVLKKLVESNSMTEKNRKLLKLVGNRPGVRLRFM